MPREGPRHPIEVVRRLGGGVGACVGGRVVSVDGSTALVRDVTGQIAIDVVQGGPAAPGDWILATGIVRDDRLTEAEVEVLGHPTSPFPRADGEWQRLTEDGGRRIEHLRARAEIVRATRDFFDERAFIEVETPLAVPSPGLDLHLDAFDVRGAAEPRFLITSPEYQMKRLLAGGLPRIYQIARCFRRGEHGGLHQPEFTMLEWYRAFAGSEEVMRDTELLVAHVAAEALDGATVIPARGEPVDVTPPWERITVREAFARFAHTQMDALLGDEEVFWRTWIERVEPRLGIGAPVFVMRWPAQMASLARLCDDDPSVADRFEAYVSGVELCNGFGELVDAGEQRARLERDQRARAAQNKPVYPIDERFLAALEEGLPPSGGNALGLDRLVMLLLGVTDIEDVLAIPASRL